MDLQEIARQLRKPEGEKGIAIGNTMNDSNHHLYEIVLEQMQLQDAETILEVGFGNGKLIPEVLAKANHIQYHGLDFSETMVAEAQSFNKNEIASGEVDIRQGNISALPYPDHFFDKVFTINTLYFWDNPESDILELYRVLKPGGKIFIGIRPKEIMRTLPFTSYGFKLYYREDVLSLLERAGFNSTETILVDEPPFVINDIPVQMQGLCIFGTKPR